MNMIIFPLRTEIRLMADSGYRIEQNTIKWLTTVTFQRIILCFFMFRGHKCE